MWKRVNNAIYAMKRKKELFSCNLCHFVCCPKCFIVKIYLPLTEPAAVGAWFWRWRSRPIWSVAPDTLQPVTVWSPGRDGSGTISTDSGVRESG